MASITLKDLSQNIDVSQVTRDARARWEKSERGRLSLEHKLLNMLPVGLVVMVLVFYSLSAPHTAHILDMVTPGWGMFAPIGFEVGLLIVSALMEAGWHARLMSGVLWLLLTMSVIINVAASFLVVVAGSPVIGGDISAYTFQELIGLYPTLPASVQLVLIMVIPVGFTIPVITKLAGEAVVKLALGKVELNATSLDDLWAAVEQREVKSALMQAALELGSGVKTAGKWSSMIIEQIYESEPYTTDAVGQHQWVQNGAAHTVRASLEGQQDSGTGQDSPQYGFVVSSQNTHNEPVWPAIDNKDSPGQGTGGTGVLTRQMVKEWLRDNPGAWREMSNHDISTEIIGSTSGYKTVQRTLRDMNMRR